MFNSLKNTLKHSLIYGMGNISSKLIGFVLLPLYTEYLTTSEYGILAILEVSSQILVSVFSLNISTAMMRWCAEAKNDQQEKTIVFTTLVSTTLISILLFVPALPFSNQLSTLFFDNPKFSNYIILLFLTSSFGILNLFPLTLMRLKQKSTQFAILNTSKFTITLILNYYFIAHLNMGVEGILLGLLLGQIFLTVFSLPLIKTSINWKFKYSILKEMVGYGLPLIFTTIFTLLLTISDRFLLKYFHGDSSVGIYSLGYKIASVINILILQSFQLGFLPIAYKKIGEKDSNRFFSKTLTYFTLLLMISALAISFFSREIITVLAQKKEFWNSFIVIPIISFAFVFKGIQYVFSLSFHYSKKTTYNAVIVIISSVVNVVLNIIFIQQFEYVGAAYSMLISTIVMMFLSYYFGRKVYLINFELRKLLQVIILGIIFYYISVLFSDLSIYLNLTLKFFLLLLFPIILYYMNFFEQVEIKRIRGAINKWKNPRNWPNNLKNKQ